ncbi:uncharacterized protein G2W53_014862 [Senna tora]|uniref:Uncharacterized protein n=1 Tax=Senna tora TaxID=362788 RepID=A0A835C4R5_9FABA|nr:uncharacterized protein G2W53_014862 [Senna tora]
MGIEKVKWMFALRASDSGIVELLLLILNIPQYDFNLKVLLFQPQITPTYLQSTNPLASSQNIYTSSARQEPVENSKQIRARDFPHLPPNQALPLLRRRRLLLLHSPEALLHFLRQDLLQRDDGAERSYATRRQHREICPVAMDPPSVVRVFAADESV